MWSACCRRNRVRFVVQCLWRGIKTVSAWCSPFPDQPLANPVSSAVVGNWNAFCPGPLSAALGHGGLLIPSGFVVDRRLATDVVRTRFSSVVIAVAFPGIRPFCQENLCQDTPDCALDAPLVRSATAGYERGNDGTEKAFLTGLDVRKNKTIFH